LSTPKYARRDIFPAWGTDWQRWPASRRRCLGRMGRLWRPSPSPYRRIDIRKAISSRRYAPPGGSQKRWVEHAFKSNRQQNSYLDPVLSCAVYIWDPSRIPPVKVWTICKIALTSAAIKTYSTESFLGKLALVKCWKSVALRQS